MPEELFPWTDEIAVFLVRPGDIAVVTTERGAYGVRGMDPTDPYPEVELAQVPHTPAQVGWGGTYSVIHGLGPGHARTPTGLRASALRRALRGHKDDQQVWEQAREALDRGPVYVRIGPVPYFGRTRLAATGIRVESAEATPVTPCGAVSVNGSRTDAPPGEAERLRLSELDRAGTVPVDNVEEKHRGAD